MSGLHIGIADHLGWAVVVTASRDHDVVDRRRVQLVDPGLPAAPIHHVGGPHQLHRTGAPLDDAALASLVAEVRTSAARVSSDALDELARSLPAPIVSMSLRSWPSDFPHNITDQRRVPYESRADPIMYRQILAELAHHRGWLVHYYEAKDVYAIAVGVLGGRTDAVLDGPRSTLGPPWSKDHRMAFAAAIVAA